MKLDAPFLDDPALVRVLDMIEAGGHRVLPVGGCVRNAVLRAPIADIDLATDARPEQVIALAEAAGLKTVPTGIEHGTVTVISGGRPFEVTTFRRDIETDGRRAVVAFSDRIEDDAARRDFTMNALYLTRKGVLIDPVGGLPDLQARRLRFVGDAHARVTEDYLRILRLFRFLAWYGREVDPAALIACHDLRDGLAQISSERIGHEMRRLLAAADPVQAVMLMSETGVMAQVLPAARPDALAPLIAAEGDATPSWLRRLVALGADGARNGFRLSRSEARGLSDRQKALDAGWSLNEAGYRLDPDAARDIALIRAARGLHLPTDWQDQLARADAARLPVSAADLAPALQGPALGRGLALAEAMWIADGFTTPRDRLIAAAKSA